MDITDPRSYYDDLIEERVENTVDAEAFAALKENEAFGAGWAVSAVVADGTGRVLLAYHGDDTAWLAPGGSVQPGESLSEAVIREVHEETGVSITPDRPHAVVENIAQHAGESLSFRLVMFSARPKTTEIGDELGEPGESIEAADWFDDIPANVFKKSLVERVRKRL